MRSDFFSARILRANQKPAHFGLLGWDGDFFFYKRKKYTDATVLCFVPPNYNKHQASPVLGPDRKAICKSVYQATQGAQKTQPGGEPKMHAR